MAQGAQAHGYQALPRRGSEDGARGEGAQSAGADSCTLPAPRCGLSLWQRCRGHWVPRALVLQSSGPMPGQLDAHPCPQPLPSLTVPLGCAAEQGIQISELGQAVTTPLTPPGSSPGSPTATEGSGASTATAADAAGTPPISELDRQEAWRLLDWAAAFFLCSSLVQLVLRRNIVAAISGCIGIVAAMAHQWWWQRPPGAVDDSSDEALELAMTLMVHFPLHNTLVIGTVSGFMQ